MSFTAMGLTRAALAAFLLASPAMATIITSYTNRATWNTDNAHGATPDINFDSIPGGSTLVNSNTTGFTTGGVSLTGYYSLGGGATTNTTGWVTPGATQVDYGTNNYIVGGYAGGSGTSQSLIAGLTINLAPSTYSAIGFDYGAFRSFPINLISSVSISVRETGSSTWTTVRTPSSSSTWPVSSLSNLNFFGVRSDSTISDVQIQFNIPSLNGNSQGFVSFDNLSFAATSGGSGGTGGGGGGTSETPEPATLLIAGASLITLGCLRRRKA